MRTAHAPADYLFRFERKVSAEIWNRGGTMSDNLAVEEARREREHYIVKSQITSEVNAEVAARNEPAPAESQRIDQFAGQLRSRAVNAVETAQEIQPARGAARASQ